MLSHCFGPVLVSSSIFHLAVSFVLIDFGKIFASSSRAIRPNGTVTGSVSSFAVYFGVAAD